MSILSTKEDELPLWRRPFRATRRYFILGADSHRKDMDNLQAYDFATESDRNGKERSERHTQYREDPFVMKRHRKLIRSLLCEETSKHSNNAPVLGDLPDTHFHKSSGAGTVSLVVPAWGTPIAKQHKTVAILDRGGPFPLLQAISGWDGAGLEESHRSQANFETLDAKYWKSEAFEIGSAIGFSFNPHEFDDSRLPGSYYASHAEIQLLMCFFISHNYIFREYEPGQTIDDDFIQLFLLQERNRPSEIVISSPPCDSCSAFAKQVLHALDIQEFVKSISYYSLPVLDDTVTEVILTLSSERLYAIDARSKSHNERNVFINHATHFDCEIREDPFRVIYQLLSEFPTFRAIDVSSVENKIEIADGRVFHVRLEYVYKTVDRSFYTKADTDAIRKELENLEYFRSAQYIAQSAGVVVSPNPYDVSAG